MKLFGANLTSSMGGNWTGAALDMAKKVNPMGAVDQLLQTVTALLDALLSQLQSLLSALQLIVPVAVGIFALFGALFLLLFEADVSIRKMPSLDKMLEDIDFALVELVAHVNRFLAVLTVFLPMFVVSLTLLLLMIIALLVLSVFLQFKRLRGQKMEGKANATRVDESEDTDQIGQHQQQQLRQSFGRKDATFVTSLRVSEKPQWKASH
ncbi:hypothetical protein niasHS_013198 [Heterodera schachtii]|uniref:Uncharacterized protein n=1 Tax=Heterodera schachtii TaxID=97005 RepID=A0ABD2IA30_HETSC